LRLGRTRRRTDRAETRFVNPRLIVSALFFAVISSALNILNVAAYWQYVVTGIFLISALGVQALRSYILVE